MKYVLKRLSRKKYWFNFNSILKMRHESPIKNDSKHACTFVYAMITHEPICSVAFGHDHDCFIFRQDGKWSRFELRFDADTKWELFNKLCYRCNRKTDSKICFYFNPSYPIFECIHVMYLGNYSNVLINGWDQSFPGSISSSWQLLFLI